MGFPTSVERAFVIEDALYNLILAATQPGQMLAAVNLVARVAPPEENVFPSIGVQLASYDEAVQASRDHNLVANFDVVLAVQANFSDQQPDTISAARAALRNLMDDGNGNGLGPLLRANVGLNGTCNRTQITRCEIVVFQGSSSAAGTLASAIYSFRAEDYVRF